MLEKMMKLLFRIFALTTFTSLMLSCTQSDIDVVGTTFFMQENQNHQKILITKGNTDATVSDVYRVYLISEKKTQSPILVLKADNLDDIKAEWIGDTQIKISLKCGRVFQFTNFADLFSAENYQRVEVIMDKVIFCK